MRLTIAALFLLSGCQAMMYGTASELERVQIGMTKEQVLKTMGRPSYVLAGNSTDEERLHYNKMAAVTSWSPDAYEVVLKDGRVVRFGKSAP